MESDGPETQNELLGASILVVEDEEEIAELIAAYLVREGARAVLEGSAEGAIYSAAETPPDLVILDLGLPGADGFQFLQAFRSRSTAPVLIVSARDADEDKIRGLGLGADDFVTKPFSPRVLMARASALLRRAKGAHARRPPQALSSLGPFRIDREGRRLTREGADVRLSPREFDILIFLIEHPGRCFRAEELHREVWGLEYGDISTVAVHIQRLRRKVEENPSEPRYILTVPGSGYRFLPGGSEE